MSGSDELTVSFDRNLEELSKQRHVITVHVQGRRRLQRSARNSLSHNSADHHLHHLPDLLRSPRENPEVRRGRSNFPASGRPNGVYCSDTARTTLSSNPLYLKQ